MRSVPPLPRLIGLLGLLPQWAVVATLYLGPPHWRAAAQAGAVAYAALIVAFVGGAWWGIAAGAPAAERRRALGWLWLAAGMAGAIPMVCLMPPLFGMPWPEPSLVMLGGTLLMGLAVDAKLGPLAPHWWMALRVPLAIGLGVATFLAALA